MTTAAVLLAAGAGRRMGVPKALLHHPDGTPWVAAAADTLAAGGCAPVIVVVGAQAGDVEAELPPGALPVRCADWQEGMSASLRTGLQAAGLLDPAPDAVVVGLVDTPGVTPEVVARLVAHAAPATLAQAAYGGAPAHPVLLGRDHWAPAALCASGEAGVPAYLATRADRVMLVECGDVGRGEDVDVPRLGARTGHTLDR